MLSEPRFELESQLEEDIEIAGRSGVPVLITAPPARALTIAQAIAARSGLAGASGMEIYDSAAGDDIVAALSEPRLKTAMREGITTFLLQEVHMLSEIEQEAIMKLLEIRASRSLDQTPRIITTSSVSLFDRVLHGAFDAKLFHRLNAIHIVVRADGG